MDVKKKEKDAVVYAKDLDMNGASRNVWLVKVPKYISSRWEKCPGNVVAGHLNITKSHQGQKPKVELKLSDAILCLQEKGDEPIPKDHNLMASNLSSQILGIFSQRTIPPGTDSLLEKEKTVMEGKVIQKLDCQPPPNNAKYMKLKRESMIKASQPTRIVKQLDHVVQTFKPISDHKHNIEFEEKKKSEGKKARAEKEKVMDMLFAAFEKHQYYNIKDLVKITNQPVTYLKEILNEFCRYNLKNPHKNMWELKDEYRHYKSDADKDDT